MLGLVVLSVADDGPDGGEGGDGGEGEHLMDDAVHVAATDKDGADGIDEIMHGIDVGGEVSQVGHGARGGEETAEQQHTDDEEPHDEDGLLHGVAIVGDDQSEAAEEQCQKHGEKIDQQQGALTGDAIDEPREHKTDGDQEEGDEPIGDNLSKDKRAFGDGGDIDLLDGALLLLAHDIQCRQEARHQHQQDGKEGGNHEYLVVEVLVV